MIRSRNYLGLDGKARGKSRKRYRGYLWGIAVTAFTTAISALMFGYFDLSNLVMIYLLGVVFVASRCGRGPSAMTALLAVAAFDFFFVPPRFSFAVSDIQYLVTFAVMLAVGLLVSSLAADLRSQAKIAGYRERRAAALYAFTRELANSRSEEEIARVAVRHIGGEFEGQSVLLLPDARDRIAYPHSQSVQHSFHGADLGVAQWVYDNNKPAGNGTDTLPGTSGVYFPLRRATGAIGVLALLPINLRRIFLPEQQRLIDTFISQIVQALDHVRLVNAASPQTSMAPDQQRSPHA